MPGRGHKKTDVGFPIEPDPFSSRSDSISLYVCFPIIKARGAALEVCSARARALGACVQVVGLPVVLCCLRGADARVCLFFHPRPSVDVCKRLFLTDRVLCVEMRAH